MEADLAEVYHVDLLDLWRYRISARKVLNLVARLPAESHTVTAIRNSMSAEDMAKAQEGGDPSRARWSNAEMLIAAVKDELAFFRSHYLAAHGVKDVDAEPMVRPGVTPKQAKGITEAQANYLAQLRADHKARQDAAAAAPQTTDDDQEGAPDGRQ